MLLTSCLHIHVLIEIVLSMPCNLPKQASLATTIFIANLHARKLQSFGIFMDGLVGVKIGITEVLIECFVCMLMHGGCMQFHQKNWLKN